MNFVTFDETIKAKVYAVEIKYFAGKAVTYSFRKFAKNRIEWTAANGSVFINY